MRGRVGGLRKRIISMTCLGKGSGLVSAETGRDKEFGQAKSDINQ